MKIKKYEKLIDNTTETLCLMGFSLFVATMVFLVLGLIALATEGFFVLTPNEASLLVLIISIISSIPFSVFWFYYKKAKKIVPDSEIRFRDFWFGFASEVRLGNSNDEINEWLEENTSHMYKRHSGAYLFASKTDAVAFKLKWG